MLRTGMGNTWPSCTLKTIEAHRPVTTELPVPNLKKCFVLFFVLCNDFSLEHDVVILSDSESDGSTMTVNYTYIETIVN